jgi:hypothetical protein
VCPARLTVMRWGSMLAPLALVLAGSGCFGGAAAPASSPAAPSPAAGLPPQPYAVFHIRAAYPTGSTNHFGGDVHVARFTLPAGRSAST